MQIFTKALNWLRPDEPPVESYAIKQMIELSKRVSFSSMLSYRDFDPESGLFFLDDNLEPAAGFIVSITPLLVAGVDAEPQIEAIFNTAPIDTVVQFGQLSTPQVEGYLNTWANARIQKNNNELLRQIALRRREFMMKGSGDKSLLDGTRFHPRIVQHFVSVRVPYKGSATDGDAFQSWIKQVVDFKNTVVGSLGAAGMHGTVLDAESARGFLREILNPHIAPSKRILERNIGGNPLEDLIERNTRITVNKAGFIKFEGTEEDEQITCCPMTVDSYPRPMYLPLTAQVVGAPDSWEDRISVPYYAYTNVHVMNQDNVEDFLTSKMALLAKQTLSESQWYSAMMAHLYDRKNSVEHLLKQYRSKKRAVRAYSGINIYAKESEIRRQTESVKGLWRRCGFRLSEEKYIAMPAFISSLPLQYTASMDPINKGLQRGMLMTSLNAASLAHVQGDWYGNSPSTGGPLLLSRKGQLATIDLFESDTNYNWVCIAESGAGKSFFSQELVNGFLSQSGKVRIIDVGRSYYRLCEILGGTNMVFEIDKPRSMNPFTKLTDEKRLEEAMPVLKDMVAAMAFPKAGSSLPDWEYAAIEEAIAASWYEFGNNADIRHVYEYLYSQEDSRAKDIAFQLQPYAKGRYSKWFCGPQEVDIEGDFVVIELEELNADPELQAVILTLVMTQISSELFLGDRSTKTLIAIDEGWSLLNSGMMKSSVVIENFFRRARKYFASCGLISQSFEDFERSQTARAIVENAAWQFILRQRPESLDFAVRNQRITNDELLIKMLKTVKPGKGFSEVYVRGPKGAGLYRFVSDPHTYFTYTSNAKDIKEINALTAKGISLADAIDKMAIERYKQLWGDDKS